MAKRLPPDMGDNKGERHPTRAAKQVGITEAEKRGRSTARLRNVPCFKLEPHDLQPLERHADENVADLVASIRVIGLQEPPLVRKVGKKYVVLAGHRRVRAWQLLASAGQAAPKMPVFVLESLSDTEAVYIVAAEYTHRTEFHLLHTARVVGAAHEARRAELGREPTLKEMTAIVPWGKSSVGELVRIYKALRDPEIGPLVQSLDDPPKLLLNKVLGHDRTRAAELLNLWAGDGAKAVTGSLSKRRTGPAPSPIKRRSREGGYDLTIAYRERMSPADAQAALSAVEHVREQLLAVLGKAVGRPTAA